MTAPEVLGIVEIKAGVGIFIGVGSGVHSDSVTGEVAKLIAKVGPLEILEVRILIEPGAAQLVAERRSAQDLRVMEGAVRQMEAELKGGESWQPDWGSTADRRRNPEPARRAGLRQPWTAHGESAVVAHARSE